MSQTIDMNEKIKDTDAAVYDAWFRAEVEAGIKEADDPETEWVSNEDAMARMYKQLEELEAKARSKA